MRTLGRIMGVGVLISLITAVSDAAPFVGGLNFSQIQAALVIAEMKQHDQQFFKQFTLHVTMPAETPRDYDWSQPVLNHYALSKYQATVKGQTCVWMDELLDYAWLDPEVIAQYTTPKEDGSIPSLYLSDRMYALKTPTFYAERLHQVLLYFNPEGRIQERKFHSHQLSLYRADLTGRRGYVPFKLEDLVLFCSGRGFSYAELSPISLQKREDGLWELRAKGYYPNYPFFPARLSDKNEWLYAEWRLIIEPSTYLVREAYWAGKLMMRTEGTRGARLPIAAVGYRAFDLFRATIYFDRVDLAFQEQWYQEVVRRLHLEDVEQAYVEDYRFTEDASITYTYRK
ncbi:MAG: hypothetical protein KatS3mg017_1059 [Fimbriimonadales bacterium]|nr:MAG: hypothetical protein KatS3mg017_1059 [Fimbriimonadales bacterium]